MDQRIEALEPRRLLSALRPDARWGLGGVVSNVAVLGAQPNGQAVGIVQTYDDERGSISTLQRLTARGGTDSTFAGFDTDTDTLGYGEGAVDADGKIYLFGGTDPDGDYTTSDGQPVVTRLRADGTIDRTYGTRGTATLPAQFAVNKGSLEFFLGSDGRVYFFEQVHTDDLSNGFPYQVGRLTTAGAFDTAYADHGLLDVTAALGEDFGYNGRPVNVDTQGRALLIGVVNDGPPTTDVYDEPTQPTRAALRRYTAAGRLDPAFADAGVYVPPKPTYGSYTYTAVAADHQGRPLVMLSAGWGDFVQRLTAAGTIDTTFGTRQRLDAGEDAGDFTTAVIVADDSRFGKPLLAADAHDRVWYNDHVLGRIDTDGTLPETAILPDENPDRLLPVGDGDVLYLANTRISQRDAVTLGRDGVLRLTGSTGNDTFSATVDGDTATVRGGGQTFTFAAGDIRGLSAELFAGDDTVTSELDLTNTDRTADVRGATVLGGAGDDSITTDAGRDSIDGGDGDDTIVTGIGADTIYIGSGSNTVDAGELAVVNVNSGGGFYLDHAPRRNHVTVRGGADFSVDLDFDDDQFVTVLGGFGGISTGSGNDHIDATRADGTMIVTDVRGDNAIATGAFADSVTIYNAGNDTIATGAGDDTVFANAGDDRVDSGPGDDRVDPGAGDDTVTAGDGNDTVRTDYNDFSSSESQDYDPGDDRIDLGAGNDVCLDPAGNNTVLGGEGDDSIRVAAGDDSLVGGGGRDTIRGGSGDDLLDGGGGRDRLFGQVGRDTLRGGGNGDVLIAGGGPGLLVGGSGDDLLVSRNGAADTLDGGSGSDRAWLDDGDERVSVETLLTDLA